MIIRVISVLLIYLCRMKKWFSFSVVLLSLLFISSSSSPEKHPADCIVENDSFSSGEEVVYQASYNWGFIWLNAGQVVFKVEKSDYKGKPCYHLSGNGGTYPSYDWIFKVRDRFESWVDTSTLKPMRYLRDISEGGRTYYNECFYNFTKLKAYCVTKEKKNAARLDTVGIAPCSFDPITMIYYSRTIDYTKYKPNDTIPISLFLDNKIYPLYIRYLGKEKIKLDDKQTFNCIKFSPLLVEGTLFKGGEGMTVWATDDKNQIPLYIEAPILVGTVKAKLMSWKGLKYKMEARVEK